MAHSRVLLGVLGAALFAVQCNQPTVRPVPTSSNASKVSFVPAPASSTVASPLEQLAQRDPVAFLQMCRDHYEEQVDDYTCTFIKQEKIGHELTAEQETVVKYRDEPLSVDMTWVRNPGDADRALYVAGRWNDAEGQPMAWVKPAGAVIKLLLPSVKQPIHGSRAKKASRRTIDQFGFRSTLDLIIRYVDQAKDDGVLDLQYRGRGEIDGRPTFVFERRLPYTGEGQPYPDRLLRYHIDAERLLPVACYSYSDDAGRELLGKYVMTDVVLNLGLSEADFEPTKVGF